MAEEEAEAEARRRSRNRRRCRERERCRPCALTGEMEARAPVNRWDLALYEEGLQLEAIDRRFFSRPEVMRELAMSPSLGSLGGSKGSVSQGGGSVSQGGAAGLDRGAERPIGGEARCGLLDDRPPSDDALKEEPRRRGSRAAVHAPPAGTAPICIHKRFRNACCFGQRPRQLCRRCLANLVCCCLPAASIAAASPCQRFPSSTTTPAARSRAPGSPCSVSRARALSACASIALRRTGPPDSPNASASPRAAPRRGCTAHGLANAMGHCHAEGPRRWRSLRLGRSLQRWPRVPTSARGRTASWEEEAVVVVVEEEGDEEEEEDSSPLASHAVMSCASQWPSRVPRP